MSDVSGFVRRSKNQNREDINKLLGLITPIAFAEPEDEALSERVIVKRHKRVRTLTGLTGLDLTKVDDTTRERFNNSYTMKVDTSTPTAYPVTNVTTGTIEFGSDNQIKGGAGGYFSGEEYITIPHNSVLESQAWGMLVTFKGDGVFEGDRTLYCKKDTSTATNAGICITLEKNSVADFSSDFSSDFELTTWAQRIRIQVADGTNSVNETISLSTDIFDGNTHTIAINMGDVIADFDNDDFSSDFAITAAGTVEVFVDKVSEGTVDITSITNSILNTRDAYFGGRDNAGTIETIIKGTTALFELQAQTYTQAEIDSYHDDNHIIVNQQLNAIHFVGDESSSVLAEIQ